MMNNTIAILETPFTYPTHAQEVYDVVISLTPVNTPIGIFNFDRTVTTTVLVGYNSVFWPDIDVMIPLLAGNAVAINCSFGDNQNKVLDYNFSPNEWGRSCFIKGTELIFSAGNWDGQTVDQSGNTIWSSWIDKTIADPYMLVAGALQWDGAIPTPIVNGQYSLSTYKIADYSMANPRFVDFFLSGYTNPYLDATSPTGFSGDKGTSFATPRLTAYVADIKFAHPEYNMSQIMTTLMNNQVAFVSDKNSWIVECIFNLATTNESINKNILIENAYEIYFGRHASPDELNKMLTNLNNGTQTPKQALDFFQKNANYTQQLCPLQQQIEGLYHLFLDRDGTDREIDDCIQYYANNDKENWHTFYNDWINFYKIVLN